MRQEQDDVREFCQKAGQPTPNTPTVPSLQDRKLRARLILEEALELINDGLGLSAIGLQGDSIEISDVEFTEIGDVDLVACADGAADLWYVGVAGVSVLCGFDIRPVVAEVTRSNMSKFIDGYRRNDGKWVKGPSYNPANLFDKIVPIQR